MHNINLLVVFLIIVVFKYEISKDIPKLNTVKPELLTSPFCVTETGTLLIHLLSHFPYPSNVTFKLDSESDQWSPPHGQPYANHHHFSLLEVSDCSSRFCLAFSPAQLLKSILSAATTVNILKHNRDYFTHKLKNPVLTYCSVKVKTKVLVLAFAWHVLDYSVLNSSTSHHLVHLSWATRFLMTLENIYSCFCFRTCGCANL